MRYNARVKVLGYTVQQLLDLGHAVNTFDCEPGVQWIIGPDSDWLEKAIKRQGIVTIGKIERC